MWALTVNTAHGGNMWALTVNTAHGQKSFPVTKFFGICKVKKLRALPFAVLGGTTLAGLGATAAERGLVS